MTTDTRLHDRIAELEMAYRTACDRADALFAANNELSRQIALAERIGAEVQADNGRLRAECAELRAVLAQAHTIVKRTYTPEDATPLHEELLPLLRAALAAAREGNE